MKVFLADGADISGSYGDDIAVSHDGISWNYIKVESINSVNTVYSRSNPKLNKGRSYKSTICIKHRGGDLKFDTQDLAVGAGTGQWTSANADGSKASLDIVRDLINNWL